MAMTDKEKYSKQYLSDFDLMGCSAVAKDDFIQAVKNIFGVEPYITENPKYAYGYLCLNIYNPELKDNRIRKVEWYEHPKIKRKRSAGPFGHIATSGFVNVNIRFTDVAKVEKWLEVMTRGFIPYFGDDHE